MPPAAQSNCSNFFITKVRSPEQKILKGRVSLLSPLSLSLTQLLLLQQNDETKQLQTSRSIRTIFTLPPPSSIIKRAKPKISQLKTWMKWISTCNTAQPERRQTGRHSGNCIDFASFSPLSQPQWPFDGSTKVCVCVCVCVCPRPEYVYIPSSML